MNIYRAFPSWRTVLSIAGLLLLLVANFYAGPLEELYLTRQDIRKSQEVWIVPKPLPDTMLVQTPGRLFSYAGFEFESPWSDVKLEKTYETAGVVQFTNGVTIMLLNATSDLPADNKMDVKTRDALKGLFGYDFKAATLNATPADLRILSNPKKIVLYSTLLQIKMALTPKSNGHMYSLQTPWMRGFQFGDPSADKLVQIEAYAPQDKKVIVTFSAASGAAKPTQEEVNRVIFSLRPAARSQ